MSGETNHNEKRSYSAEDLRRYLAGEMSPADMHALEQASLEDPMLEDALEGMREIKGDTREDLAMLHRRLGERAVERNRVIPLWRSPVKIAVAVVLLIGLATLGRFFITGADKSKEIAVSTEKAKTSADTPEPAAPVPAANNDSGSRATPAKPVENGAVPEKTDPTAVGAPVASARAKKAKTGKPSPAATADADREESERGAFAAKADEKKESVHEFNRFSPAPAAPVAASETLADSMQSAVASSGDAIGLEKDKSTLPADSANGILQGRAAGVELSKRMNRKSMSVGFSGQVLDDKGQAVAGASVQMGKTNTTTDIQGKFSIPSTQDENAPLDFNSAGYQSVTLVPDLQHRSNMIVTLTPATTALNDVVVTGYATKKKSADFSQTASPAPGWRHYRNYLGANKIQPSIDSSLHGTEKVTFTITKDGSPVDFVVDQSVSSEHDSVTIRIIRNGPKWKPANDTTRRISLALPY